MDIGWYGYHGGAFAVRLIRDCQWHTPPWFEVRTADWQALKIGVDTAVAVWRASV